MTDKENGFVLGVLATLVIFLGFVFLFTLFTEVSSRDYSSKYEECLIHNQKDGD